MALEQVDPGTLEGDDLRTCWYMRSPEEIEQERAEAAAQRYQDFFGESGWPWTLIPVRRRMKMASIAARWRWTSEQSYTGLRSSCGPPGFARAPTDFGACPSQMAKEGLLR